MAGRARTVAEERCHSVVVLFVNTICASKYIVCKQPVTANCKLGSSTIAVIPPWSAASQATSKPARLPQADVLRERMFLG